MDLLDELEHLAVSATYEEPGADENVYDQSQGRIKMWQGQFDYTYEEAVALIGITKSAKRASNPALQAALSPAQARAVYLLQLGGPISTVTKVQMAANLPNIPEPYYGSSDNGDSIFCKVDGRAKMDIESWLSTQKESSFKALFVPIGKAYKELSSHSIYPTLGKDTTLPQFRPTDPHLLSITPYFGQEQYQYPVWYFFYGTLASIEKLCSLLSLPENSIPILHSASVIGGRMETWGKRKYKALIDGQDKARVKGSAYQVISEEHENMLRKYETEAYEVVRCLIEMDGITIQGCTFRFVGEIDRDL